MAQIKKENIQGQLLRAARREFLRHGFQGASLRGIAERAQVSLANIYNYYRDKDALYIAVLQQRVQAGFQDRWAADDGFKIGQMGFVTSLDAGDEKQASGIVPDELPSGSGGRPRQRRQRRGGRTQPRQFQRYSARRLHGSDQ